MTTISLGLAYDMSRPNEEPNYDVPSGSLEDKNKGTIIDLLEPDFKVFKKVSIKAGYYALFNDPNARITLFAFPDKYLSQEAKNAFDQLDSEDAKKLIGMHIHDRPKLWERNFAGVNYELPVFNRRRIFINGIKKQIFFDGQVSPILSGDNVAKNGNILVIKNPIIPVNY